MKHTRYICRVKLEQNEYFAVNNTRRNCTHSSLTSKIHLGYFIKFIHDPYTGGGGCGSRWTKV